MRVWQWALQAQEAPEVTERHVAGHGKPLHTASGVQPSSRNAALRTYPVPVGGGLLILCSGGQSWTISDRPEQGWERLSEHRIKSTTCSEKMQLDN